MNQSAMMLAHRMGSGDDMKDARPRKGTARRVLGYTRPYRSMVIGFVIVVVLTSLLAVVPPLALRAVLDDALPDGDRRLLNVLGAIVVAGALAQAGLSFAERWWSSRIGEGLIYDLRRALFDHVQGMPIGFFTRTQTGALVSRMNNDVIGAQRAVTGTLGTVVSNVVTLTTSIVVMLLLEWRLTLLALVLLPLFIVPARRVGRRLATITREGMNLNASMNTQMTERFNVSGALLVKLFGRADAERREFSERADRVRAIGVRSAMYSRVFLIALTLVGALGTAAVYWIGGHLVVSGTITDGTLVALSLLVASIYTPLTSLTNARVDVMSALVSFERVFEVLDAPNPITDAPDAIELPLPAGRIQFDHVTFHYPASDQIAIESLEMGLPRSSSSELVDVLHDISFTIEPGRTVALVGPSGAGKTTISQLVPRVYDVNSGSVRIGGTDVRDLSLQSLRDSIGVVAQDAHLFHDTIRANLLYAQPDAAESQLVDALRAAQIWDLVSGLPQGLDTVVGDRGHRLSGGEKQRLAIARVLLKAPAIVILDEATAHLDSESEVAVQRALAAALEGRTSLVIAHRLSTIRSADQILVVDGGRVVQSGTHAELIAAGGPYAELYRTQFEHQPLNPVRLPR
jgi:ATP-binding cassette subfamily B protein